MAKGRYSIFLSTSWGRFATAGILLVLALVVFGGLQYFRSKTASGAAADATLVLFLGSAQLTAAGTQNANAVVSGTHLHGGDMVTTGPNSKANLIFGDGSQTRLDANTTIVVKTLTHDTGGFHVDLQQTVGKTWSRVVALVGTSSFTVHGPNNSTAEVRGTEFSVYIRKDAAGRTVVEVVTWTGVVDVTASTLKTVSVSGGSQVTIQEKQTTPLTTTAVSKENQADQFTIFNNAVNQSQAAAPASSPAPGANGRPIVSSGPTSVGTGTLAQGGETTVQPGVPVASTGNTDVVYSLDWPGSTFELVVIDPDGNEYLRQASTVHPFSVILPKVRAGQWQFKVHDIQSETSEMWVVIVTTISPSTHAATPIFTNAFPCDHSVQAGAGADAWSVTARDPAGAPTLALTAVRSNPPGTSALPDWATFTATSGAFNFAPPIDTAASDLTLNLSATFSGQPAAALTCSEHVIAAPHESSLGGTVVYSDGGQQAATVALTRQDSAPLGSWALPPAVKIASAASDSTSGAFSFGGLRAASYSVTVTPPAGYHPLGDAPPGQALDGMHAGTAVRFELAPDTNSTVRGRVLSGGSGLGGVRVGDGISSTNTGADGGYSFRGLTAGIYTITVTVPSGYAADGSGTVRTVTVVANAAATAADFVFRRTNASTISGRATIDGNPAGGLLATITPGGATTTTGVDGSFAFAGLTAGTYSVSVQQLQGWTVDVNSSSRTATVDGQSAASLSPAYAFYYPAPAGTGTRCSAPAAMSPQTGAPANAIYFTSVDDGAPAWSAQPGKYDVTWQLLANPQLVGLSPSLNGAQVTLAAGDNGCLPAPSTGSRAFWFGSTQTGSYIGSAVPQQPSTANGGTGATAQAGALDSPLIDLRNQAHASLTFKTWFEIEANNASTLDLMKVQVRDLNSTPTATAGWATLATLNPVGQDCSANSPCPAFGFGSGGGRQAIAQWLQHNLALDLYVGHQIQLRFLFDTVDTSSNGFRGWLLDDIAVLSTPYVGAASQFRAASAKLI